ncbi:MAG: hypothetical protein HY276_03165, partial [Ignavibacteriales bacterium]|nr:hypothetical protein [Ignavibacteriales bacterium]
MNPRERILTAMRRGIPDHVPVMPDISNMVPARLTGKPFWDIYLYENPSLDEAYVNAVQYYGMDGWYVYDNATMVEEPKWQHRILESSDDEMKVQRWTDTPFGRLEEITCYPVKDPPWAMSGMIKNIAEDFPKLKWYMEQKPFENPCRNRSKIGAMGIYAVAIETFMGFWVWARDGGSMQALQDFFQQPEMMKQVREFYLSYVERVAKRILREKPDEILLAGSASSMSLSSPKIYREYDLPIIKTVASLCNEAGIICHQHTCGCSRLVVEINYNETGVDVMEPLERPPGGDVDLAEVKRKFGDKFCLKGNVNTFETMLNGSVREVEEEAKACIDAAAEGGGFILATGDQCGRDTPDENLFALVEVAKTY